MSVAAITPSRFCTSNAPKPQGTAPEDPFYDDFDFSFLDELCDEMLCEDLSAYIPQTDISFLGNEANSHK